MAGALLKRAGHHVTIIEANGNRISGRIKTFRRGPESPRPPFRDARLYTEAGAMRLPDFSPMTLALADKLGLRRRLFFTVNVDPATGNQNAPVPAVSYRSFTDEVWRNGPANTDFRAPTQVNRTWSSFVVRAQSSSGRSSAAARLGHTLEHKIQAKPPACYRASWQLPGPDSHRQATTSFRSGHDRWTITS